MHSLFALNECLAMNLKGAVTDEVKPLISSKVQLKEAK